MIYMRPKIIPLNQKINKQKKEKNVKPVKVNLTKKSDINDTNINKVIKNNTQKSVFFNKHLKQMETKKVFSTSFRKTIKTSDEIILNKDYLEILDYANKRPGNLYISLTTIPPRLVDDEFENVIKALCFQEIKAKKIIIHLCKCYKREFNINVDSNHIQKKIYYLTKKYPSIVFNLTDDYGPITKILGLHNSNIKMNDNDIVIVVDDDWIMNSTMTFYYCLSYQLYNCDCIFIDEKNVLDQKNMVYLSNDGVVYDNYHSYVYGWLSFSFKYKHIKKLYDFYYKYIDLDMDLWKHDDLILTLFYQKENLYACGINLYFNNCIKTQRKNIEENHALREEPGESTMRERLVTKMLKKMNINLEKTIDRQHHFISSNINERDILYNIRNITYDPELNDMNNMHIDLKYLEKNIFILTLSYFSSTKKNNIILKIGKKVINLKVNINSFSKKETFLIKTKEILELIPHQKYNFDIVQTSSTNSVSKNKLFSICTILSYIPDVKYKFFNDHNASGYLNNHFPQILPYYDKLVPGAYKSDLFRALYIYHKGGIYFDCKNILLTHVDFLSHQNEVYCQDINPNYVYNSFIFSKISHNKNLQNYICHMIYNINHDHYGTNCLEVTGPGIMGLYIKKNILLQNNIDHNCDWKQSYVSQNKNILIKNSYPEYYSENNYLKKNHYSTLWEKKNIYHTNTNNHYNKINGIDGIAWINLDRCFKRRKHMEELLGNINIPRTRIIAIDGNDNISQKYNSDQTDAINNIEMKKITKYEIACLLSHLKAINYLSKSRGKYFMVCEDDVCFNNLSYFNINLSKIIQNAPLFDILLINKTTNETLKETYTNWNDLLKKKVHIASAVCYIISDLGIRKIENLYNLRGNKFIFKTKIISNSDIFLYSYTNTYVYKYNIASTLNNDSTIHEDHIRWHIKSTFMDEMNIIHDLLF